MAGGETQVETEVKLAMNDAIQAHGLLERFGFVLHRERLFERNVILDTEDRALRRSGRLLRLRRAGTNTWVTFKGLSSPGPHKSREEVEFEVGSFEAALKLFAGLGYGPVFRYEKYRAEYRRPHEPGVVTLDETPIGVFFELEGPPAWIDQTAAMLGFSTESYITSSYGTLYLDHCRRAGITPENMEFLRTPVP